MSYGDLEAPQSYLQAEITTELEFIFSDENLSKDFKLREYMDSQGFVALQVLFTTPGMRKLRASAMDVCLACENVSFLEVLHFKDGVDRVRRRHGWSDWVLPYEYRDKSLKSPPEWDDEDSVLHPSVPKGYLRTLPYAERGDDWKRRASDVSGGVSFRERDAYAKEQRHGQLPNLDPRSEDVHRHVSRELPRRDDKERESAASGTTYEDPNDKAIARVLQRNEKDAQRFERRDSPPIDPSRPVYTKMSRRHLSLETLRAHKIDYEIDQVR
jgi:hypothetical protein